VLFATVRAGDPPPNSSTAVCRRLDNQASRTRETHRQQVSTEASDYKVNQETETGFKRTVNNPGHKVLNCVIFQLTQEYIVVLALVDAQLALHNGNPRQSQIVPIADMASLLDRCLVAPQARARVAATVADVLQKIVDHAGQARSLLTPNPTDPARYQVNRTLTSTIEIKDSSGAAERTIVVPGIVLNVDRPVILRPNTATAPLAVD
jgi:hypothetical protein